MSDLLHVLRKILVPKYVMIVGSYIYRSVLFYFIIVLVLIHFS